MAIVTAHGGENADLILAASTLYIRDGARVADVTYGLGAFWKKTDTSRFDFMPSDLRTLPKSVDFRSLPYESGTIDVVVLDPPYIHNPGNHQTDKRYNNAATTKGMYHADIMQLYWEGMTEARRVLNPDGGQLWVKCKDQVESSIQRWSHVEIYEFAVKLGLYPRDLFVIIPSSRTSTKRWAKQYHARKNHSFLWILERRSAPVPKQPRRR